MECDSGKSAKNDKDRGLPFQAAAWLEWKKAVEYVDARSDYGETRIIALVPKEGRLFVDCSCNRNGARRIISFRKANKREERIYAEAIPER